MGLSPRIVTEDTVFLWDGVSQRLPKGQVIDVPPDSPLERAIGAVRLVPLGAAASAPPAQKPAAAGGGGGGGAANSPAAGDITVTWDSHAKVPQAAPESRTTAKKQDDAEDGDDS